MRGRRKTGSNLAKVQESAAPIAAQVMQVRNQFPYQGELMLCDNAPPPPLGKCRGSKEATHSGLSTPSILILIFQGIHEISTRNHCRAQSLRMVRGLDVRAWPRLS